ncbi:MAG: hypothetical protein U9N14_07935, partial [Pseudomonadota bacterium]|nr:hypothetical protein [Pseudomonadota bacterium]
MEISELDIKTPALHLQGLAGWGTMERSPSGSMTATAGAESSVVRVLGIEAPTAIASYSLDDASMTASIRAGAEGTGRLSFDADLLRATRQLTLQMAATGTDLGDISGVPDLGGALYVDLAGLLPDAADIDPLSLTGRIKADMTGLAVPGVVSDGTLRLRALLDIGEDGLTITPDEVVTLEGDLPSFFAESIGAARGQWRLDATKTGSARFVFGSGPEMAVSGRVSIASDNQELAGAVLDDVRIQKNVSGVWTLGGQVRDMSTAPLAFDRARFDVENGHVKISGSPDDLTLTGRIGAHLHGWVRDVAGFRNLRLALSGTVRRTGDDLSYHGDGCQMIDAASIRSKDWMLLLPKGVCLKPEGDTPMIAVGPDGIMADLNVRNDPFALRQVKADNPVALSGALPDIRLIFSPSDLSVSLKGGKIGIKDGVRAEDIGGALTIGDDVDVSMNIAKLMVPGLVPLSAAIGAKGALGELLSVTARVAGAGGALIVASEGSVDPLAGVG